MEIFIKIKIIFGKVNSSPPQTVHPFIRSAGLSVRSDRPPLQYSAAGDVCGWMELRRITSTGSVGNVTGNRQKERQAAKQLNKYLINRHQARKNICHK